MGLFERNERENLFGNLYFFLFQDFLNDVMNIIVANIKSQFMKQSKRELLYNEDMLYI